MGKMGLKILFYRGGQPPVVFNLHHHCENGVEKGCEKWTRRVVYIYTIRTLETLVFIPYKCLYLIILLIFHYFHPPLLETITTPRVFTLRKIIRSLTPLSLYKSLELRKKIHGEEIRKLVNGLISIYTC